MKLAEQGWRILGPRITSLLMPGNHAGVTELGYTDVGTVGKVCASELQCHSQSVIIENGFALRIDLAINLQNIREEMVVWNVVSDPARAKRKSPVILGALRYL
jgi:hypothetical protein